MSDLFAGGAPVPETYDASAIEVLEGLEPVRRRPGMYVGGTDERAYHHLAAEVLDNSMDEAVAGHATRIDVTLGRRRLADRRGQRPRHPDRRTSQVPRQVGARGDSDDAPLRRQILEQGLCDFGRPPRRRRQRRQRAVVAPDDRGGAEPRALPPGLFARAPVDAAGGGRRGAQPARHDDQLPPRHRDIRQPRASVRPASIGWRARRPISSAASRSAGAAIPR